MKPSLSPLEVRLERLKNASNLRLEYLKRLYDRRPIGELYGSGEHCLHIHFRSVRHYCAMYCAGHIPKIDDMISVGAMERKFMISSRRNKMDMLVGIGQVFKNGSPIASTVRLQRLDCCNMCAIEAVEPSSLYAPLKSLFLVFDRKLSALNEISRIEPSEFENQIIERRPDVINDLPNEDAETKIHGEMNLIYDKLLRVIRIGIEGNRIDLFLPSLSDFPYKISKVFFCPTYPRDSAIKRRYKTFGNWIPKLRRWWRTNNPAAEIAQN